MVRSKLRAGVFNVVCAKCKKGVPKKKATLYKYKYYCEGCIESVKSFYY